MTIAFPCWNPCVVIIMGKKLRQTPFVARRISGDLKIVRIQVLYKAPYIRILYSRFTYGVYAYVI